MDENDPVEAALEAVEQNKAVEHAAKVNSALNELDSHIIMLRGMGVNVSVALDAPTSRPLDKIEQPGSTKAPGWYAYVDFMDEEGTKRRIDAAKRAVAYAIGGQ